MEQQPLTPHRSPRVDARRVAGRALRFQVVRIVAPAGNAIVVIALLYLATGGGVLFIAGVGSIVFLAITYATAVHFDDPRTTYERFMPMAPLIQVAESNNAPHGPVALEWSRRCRAYGITKSMTFANPLLDTLFASVSRGFPPLAVLFLPRASAVERFSVDELKAIIEHEIAHVRLSRPFFRATAEFFCLPSQLLLRGMCTIRIRCMRYEWWKAARGVHCCERIVFLMTYCFVCRMEEYAADAFAAYALGTPHSMISALETFRMLVERPFGESELAQLPLAHVPKRATQRHARSLRFRDEFDRNLMRHPTFDERRKALLALCP